MILKRLTVITTAVASALVTMAGVNFYKADASDTRTDYVISSSVDEVNEDGQYPRYKLAQTGLASASINLNITGKLFGVTVPTHDEKFLEYDKAMGIDVSKWNGDIDWAKVKAQGIEYAIIRVGYRGYGSAGTLVLDETFHENISEAIANDIKVGVYFFTQAINTAEAVEEAQFVLKQIEGYKLDLPVVFDIEDAMTSNGDIGRVDAADLTRQQYTDLCIAFCDAIIEAGCEAMVYGNPNWFTTILYIDQLEDKYPIWLAHYVSDTNYAGKYEIWQYSNVGVMNGIPEYVDLNIVYVSPLATPTNVSATVGNDEKITLTWDKAKGADGYVVYKVLETDENIEYVEIDTTTDTTYTVKEGDYTPGETNTYALKSYKIKDEKTSYSDMTPDISVNAEYTSPTGVKLDENTDSSLALSWDKYDDNVIYQIFTQKDGETSFSISATTTNTNYTLKNLTPATVYNVKVRAVYMATNVPTPYSTTYSCATKPAKTEGLTVTDRTTDTITVLWNEVSNADSYTVYSFDEATGEYTPLCTTDSTKTVLTELLWGKKYNLTVTASITTKDGSFEGDMCETVSTYTKAKTPENVTSTSYETSIKLSWESCGEDVSYNIYRYNADTKNYTLLATTDKLTYTVTDLENVTKYGFKVKAITKDKTVGGTSLIHWTYTSVAKPVNVKFSKVGASSVTVTWDKVENATGYAVCLLNESTGKYTTVKRVTGNSWTISSLPSGKACTVYVRAFKTVDGTRYYGDRSDLIYTATTPATVKNVTFEHENAKEDFVDIYWTKQSYVTGYQIYKYDETAGKYVFAAQINTNKASLILPSGTNYSLKVRAFTEIGGKKYYGGFSSTCEAFTRSSAPESIKVKSNTDTSITLSWDKPVGAKGYAVFSYNASTGKYTLLSETTKNSYTVSGLKTGTTYRFAVKSYRVWNSAVWYSDYSEVKAAITKPAKVTGVEVTKTTNNSATIKWDSIYGVGGYRVYSYDSATGKYTVLSELKKTSVTVTGLEEGKEYVFVVRSFKSCGGVRYYSPYISDKAYTHTAPGLPESFTLNASSTSVLNVKWSESENATGYRVYLYDEESGKYIAKGETTALNYRITGLSPATDYKIAVKPFVEYNGVKIYSPVYVSKYFVTKPLAVKNISQTASTESSVTLSWDAVAGADGYYVYYYDSSTKTYRVIADTVETDVEIKNLDPNTSYGFKVKAYTICDNIKYGGSASAMFYGETE